MSALQQIASNKLIKLKITFSSVSTLVHPTPRWLFITKKVWSHWFIASRFSQNLAQIKQYPTLAGIYWKSI